MPESDVEARKAPTVSVVVPCRNEVDHIGACLRSILHQEAPLGDFEVLVVDGMSDDGTREVIEKLAQEDSRVRAIENASQITPCGMNCGIRAARGNWIAIMGSHNRYARDYLIRCLEVAHATGADNVGGAMFSEGDGLLQRAIAAAHHSPFSVGGARWHDPSYEGPADTVFGGFYRRQIFERIGLFDEELVRNQDDELNLRLTRAGGKIWQSPLIRSWYAPRSSLRDLLRQYSQYGYWKVRVIQKNQMPASWRHLVPGTFILLLLALLLSFAVLFTGSAIIGWYTHRQVPAFNHGFVALRVLAFFLGLYGCCAGLASLHTAMKTDWRLLPLLPAVFACYHFGYGYGFLRGIIDFSIRKRRPGRQFVELTRKVSHSDHSRS